MAKVWVNIILTEENVVSKKAKQLMTVLFELDRSISWEENFSNCMIENIKRIGVIDLAGRDLDLKVSGVRLNASDESVMFGVVSALASIMLSFFKLDNITVTFMLLHVAPSEVSSIVTTTHLMHITFFPI
jgi:hypothetical protein